jgi:O-antigen/teichoic acid export membrane protein
MISRLKLKSEYGRNVLTLMTGTTIAQALPMAAAPILTRIFSPEDFGIFAFYFSIVSILGVLVTARYELAIVLPKRRDDAYQIVMLSWAISTFVSIFTFFIIWLFESQIALLLDNPVITSWLYWIPLSIFLMGIYQSLYYWFNREKAYKNMSESRILQSSVTLSSQIGFGFLTKLSAFGLILGQVLGQTLATFYMSHKFFKQTKGRHTPNRLKQFVLAKRYINFPKFLLVAHSMNATCIQLPVIFFNTLFTSSVAGFYLLIQRVIGTPITIVGGAIGDVFRQSASKAYAERGECVSEYKNTLKKLLMISILPFTIFLFIAPDLFAIIFGKNWSEAGKYAQILTPMFFLQFISSPLSNMYLIAEKQKNDLYLNVILFIVTLLPFLLAMHLTMSVETVISFFSLFYSLIYAVNLIVTFNFAKGR